MLLWLLLVVVMRVVRVRVPLLRQQVHLLLVLLAVVLLLLLLQGLGELHTLSIQGTIIINIPPLRSTSSTSTSTTVFFRKLLLLEVLLGMRPHLLRTATPNQTGNILPRPAIPLIARQEKSMFLFGPPSFSHQAAGCSSQPCSRIRGASSREHMVAQSVLRGHAGAGTPTASTAAAAVGTVAAATVAG